MGYDDGLRRSAEQDDAVAQLTAMGLSRTNLRLSSGFSRLRSRIMTRPRTC